MLGAAVAFLGGTLLLSWYVHTLRLVSPEGDYVPMQYNTALGFLIAGLAVVAACTGRRRLALWGGALAAGFGSMVLAEHVLGRSFGVLARMFGGRFAGIEAGRMSATSALCFALTGCLLLANALPGSRRRWRRAASTLLASVLMASAFVGLMTWLEQDTQGRGWPRLTGMEGATAAGFLGLGAAFFVMVWRLKDGPELHPGPAWAGWVVGACVAALTVGLWTSLTASDARLTHVAETRSHSAALSYANQTRRAGGSLEELRARGMAESIDDLPGLTGIALVDGHSNVLWTMGATDAADLQIDLAGEPRLRTALRLSREERMVTASEPVDLAGKPVDLFVMIPLNDELGTLVFEHDMERLMDGLFGAGVAFDVVLETVHGEPFYSSHGTAHHDGGPVSGEHREKTSGRIAFANQLWEMHGHSGATWVAGVKTASNTLILWFGLFLAVALAFAMRKSELLRQRALSLVAAKRTIEENASSLEGANRSLQDQARHLMRTESRLTRAAREKRAVLDSLSAILIGVDGDGCVTEWNSVGSELFGLGIEHTRGKSFADLPLAWDRRVVLEAARECRETGERVRRESLCVAVTPVEDRLISITISPTQTDTGRGFAIIGADITERQQLEMQLHQAQRLESVGTLAAGIAHEINTPMQFVGDNLNFVSSSVGPLANLLALMPELQAAAKKGRVKRDLQRRLDEALQAMDADFLSSELPAALAETQDGVERVTTIVRAMKDFSHPGNPDERRPADLNKAVSTTLAVARNEYKYFADVETDFSELPEVDCYIADLNQVFLNLIVNAAHAIRDAVGDDRNERGTIRISTHRDGDIVEVRVSDTGCGIREEDRGKIFDQFFTTKEIGRGTGLGLSIARQVVVERHGGSLDVQSEPGEGATFIVRLPISPVPGPAPDPAADPAPDAALQQEPDPGPAHPV
jgi:PAS domain S-box-containing protein